VGVDPISLGVLTAPGDYGADIVTGPVQPLGVHMNCGGGVGGFIASRDEERYVRAYNGFLVSIAETREPGQYGFGLACAHQNSYGMRERGNDWTGNSTYLWAIAGAVYMSLLGPEGFREVGTLIVSRARYAAKLLAEVPGVRIMWPDTTFKEFVVNFDGHRPHRGPDQRRAPRARHLRGQGPLGRGAGPRPVRALVRDRSAHRRRHPPRGRRPEGGAEMTRLPQFHAAKWDEPVVMELGRPGGRGQLFPAPEPEVTEAVGADLIPGAMARKDRPELPEITEFEAQRHYLHLSR
jgi:hypothetical protein